MKQIIVFSVCLIFSYACKKKGNPSTPAATTAQLTTGAVTNINITAATGGGTITTDGGAAVTARGLCWATTSNPSVANNKTSDGTGSGPFTTSITGLSANTTYYVKAYATNSAGTAYGNEISFTTLPDNSVTIGTQTWLKKNLDVTTYRNGDPIPEVKDMQQWGNLTTGAWCHYNNNPANDAVYGKLYNWYALTDPRGLAPTGWHTPSQNEWITLQNFLGGYAVAGGALKHAGTTYWQSPNSGASNSSGFTGLPSGYRHGVSGVNNSPFFNITTDTYFWSSTQMSATHAYSFRLTYTASGNEFVGHAKVSGLAVRCIKD